MIDLMKDGVNRMTFDKSKNPYAIRAEQIANLHSKITEAYCGGSKKYPIPRMIAVSNKLYLHLCKMNDKTIKFEQELMIKD